ncbi:hypothetical protein [Streptomyces xanthochromogenes]|uniref:Uncharacterized protein n=1 Tax=Streptomyces xanthochromogenes TaxID=67384 RepID=A0ABQ3ANP2_9ACTN|nr:hypothetical protein [Streptomyces xanthochromogenes]GGY61747.1 hypothetical protein GCM10010326_65740 [Streptomyces xanthochromogenes]
MKAADSRFGTLFDPGCIQHIRDALMLAVPGSLLATAVSTHADPGHCWRNQLFSEAVITVPVHTAREMGHGHRPGPNRELLFDDRDPVPGSYLHDPNRGFGFEDIEPPSPSRACSRTALCCWSRYACDQHAPTELTAGLSAGDMTES